MWIDADAKHWMIVNPAKLDTIYVMYRGPSAYALVGTIGDRDITLKVCKSEKEAVDVATGLRAKLEID